VEDITAERLQSEQLEMHIRENRALTIANQKQSRSLEVSEDRFQKVFEFSPVALCIIGFDKGDFLYVNHAFTQLSGYPSASLIGYAPVEMGILTHRQRLAVISIVLRKKGSLKDVELEIITAPGNPVKVLGSIDLSSFNGEKCFLVALVNITDRKAMEISLKQSNRFLDTILENIPSMVYVKDAHDLSYIRVNNAVERVMRTKRARLTGKTDKDLFSREIAARMEEEERELLKGKDWIEREEALNTPDGSLWLRTRKIAISEYGQPRYVLGISEDITEQKAQKDAIMDLNKELESFSYSVSHDLRAPLRAICGFTDILYADYSAVLDEKGRSYLMKVTRNAQRMGKLIDDLLAFSKLGRKELQKTDTSINDIVKKVIADLGRTSNVKALISYGLLHNARVDAALMHQVFFNLVGNAVKYSSGVEDPRINIASEIKDGFVIYSIADNGAGFDMKFAGKLFGVFQRLHRADEFEGQGVGLAIVHRIVKKHGGSVWAEGAVKAGATFYFKLPITE
jgi:PAS domain S-box-containing protein